MATHFIEIYPRTREPDAEDNEEQALIRKRRAEATAVDGTAILEEAQLLQVCFFLRVTMFSPLTVGK